MPASSRNWFEEHPARSIVAHSILVATATWAVSYFVLDSRRVDNLETVIRTLQAKIDGIQAENQALRQQNDKYEEILRNSPGTIQYYEQRLSALARSPIASSQTTAAGSTLPSQPPAQHVAAVKVPYVMTATSRKGEAFADPETSAVLGVSQINPDYTVNGVLTLPGKEGVTLDRVSPGVTWPFAFGGRQFVLALTGVNWTNDSYTVAVRESTSR